MDGHAGADQIDIHDVDLPRGLNADNLAIALALVDQTGLESGSASSLSEVFNPDQTGKNLLSKHINSLKHDHNDITA